MSHQIDISWEQLHSLFSIVMCMDDSMSIVYASDTLVKCLPITMEKPQLSDVFDTLRPASLDTFQQGLKSLGSLCLMTARSSEFAIRGQLIETRLEDQDVLCFCGAPWLFWINTNSPKTRLTLNDFSAQDVQLDQLFFMSTERQMVDDLEKLNDDLQKAKVELEQAQETQRLFFAQMSHEIRTPLNAVVSALSLLGQCPMNAEQNKFVELARSSSKNLMEVINYVLGISKIELSGRQEQVLFGWPDLIRSSAEVVAARAQEKSLELKIELAPDLPKVSFGSPALLRQTLLNLLINAIKFTDEGNVTIRALPLRQADQQSTLRLEVVDTGVGITDDKLQHIFEPFWSESPEGISSREEGTGLGLDIVRRNVQIMGGEIYVKSTPGTGTVFWFELPVRLPSPAEHTTWIEKSQHPVETATEPPELAGTVLLVDDNQTNLVLGSLILESMGLEVTSVDGGHAAIASARQGLYDLVLMDISMPDIDGLEATRRIRDFAHQDQLPIIALTAHIDDKEKQACFDVGMNDYLTKPIDSQDLNRALARWLAVGKPPDADTDAAVAAGESPVADRALVDENVLTDLIKQIGSDNLQLVIDNVQTESIQRWQELEIAESEGDTAAVRRHVHSLASIFRSVGLFPVGDSLSAVEDTLRAGEAPAPGWLQELVQLRADSLDALNRQSATS